MPKKKSSDNNLTRHGPHKDWKIILSVTTKVTRRDAKRRRLQITDSVVSVQDDRMGFHICIVGY